MIAYKNGGLTENWCALYLAICKNYTSDQALNRLGISRTNKTGSKLSGKKYEYKKDIDMKKAKELYESGMTLQEVANAFNVSMFTMFNRFKDEGIKTRGRGAYKAHYEKERNIHQ